jgi:hypothetical protein
VQCEIHPEPPGDFRQATGLGIVAHLARVRLEQRIGVVPVHAQQPIARVDAGRAVRPPDDQLSLIVQPQVRRKPEDRLSRGR